MLPLTGEGIVRDVAFDSEQYSLIMKAFLQCKPVDAKVDAVAVLQRRRVVNDFQRDICEKETVRK